MIELCKNKQFAPQPVWSISNLLFPDKMKLSY